jgi:phosphoglycolate phosphatase-like HAD superfamily hydrolase
VNIFFDFDGVILESLDAKTNAFKKIYEEYGLAIQSKVAKHHLSNGGISRFEKFKIYHQDFLGISIDDQKINELADQFSKIVFEEVVNSKFVDGVNSFLDYCLEQNIKMWIISGTPTEELRKICECLDLKKYFTGIFGSPEKKDFWCKKIISENELDKKSIFFFGDALADQEAANLNQLKFVLRETDTNHDLFRNFNGFRIKDFNDVQLKNWIKQ